MSAVPEVRWTPRRVRTTAFYAVIGFAIGVTLTGVLVGVAFAVLHGMMRVAVRPTLPSIALASVAVGAVSYFLLWGAADGTCRKHPAAPAGIAIGLIVGNLVPMGFALSESSAASGCIILFAAVAQAVGGYRGGMRGLAHRFSLTAVEGVGVLCAHCGYDLAATAAHWPCPECGGRMRFAARTDDA